MSKREKTKVLLCSKERKRHGKVKEEFFVDWLHEKKSDVKENEKNFENLTCLERKLAKEIFGKTFR